MEKSTVSGRLKKKKGKEDEKKKEEEVPGRRPRLCVARAPSPPAGRPRAVAARETSPPSQPAGGYHSRAGERDRGRRGISQGREKEEKREEKPRAALLFHVLSVACMRFLRRWTISSPRAGRRNLSLCGEND
ncbi:hypothetical protein BHM03_00055283 [Ensete ventricosum]|nr:hypothetical protein BHM03_00055283 [Ensete ventricosum]